jgi:HSP20 family protein
MAGQEVERRREWPDVPDVFGRWFTDWPRWPSLRSWMESTFEGVEPMRIEETVEGDQLVVKAELPGIDPDKDVEISVQDRTLHIRAERRQETTEETKSHHRSEFRYGSFARRIQLPEGASEEQVTASYKDGILEVRVPLPVQKPAEAARKIQVQRT